jgi:hypothetical protein
MRRPPSARERLPLLRDDMLYTVIYDEDGLIYFKGFRITPPARP